MYYTSNSTTNYRSPSPSARSTSPYVTRDSYTEVTIPSSMATSSYLTSSYSTSTTSPYTSTTTPSYSTSETLLKPYLNWENFVLINVEMDRITSLYQNLQSENEVLKIRAEREIIVSAENNQLKQELSLANQQITNLAIENKKISELESKISQITLQLIDKSKENESWKIKYTEMSGTANRYSNIHENIRKENEQFKVELEKASQVAKEFEILKIQTAHLNKQLDALAQARDKLNGVITEKDREIKDLKSQLGVLEKVKAALINSEQERKELQGLWEGSEELIEELRGQVTGLLEQVPQEEDDDAHLESLEGLEGFKAAIEKLNFVKEKIDVLIIDKEGLSFALKEKEAELDQSRNEAKKLVKQNEDKQKEVERMKVQVSTMASNVNQYKQEKERLEHLLTENGVQTQLLEAQVKDLVERIKIRGNKEALMEKYVQLQKEKDENELKIKEIRMEKAQKKLNALAAEKSRLTVTNTLLSDGIMGKTDKRRGFSRMNTFTASSRTSITPKSTKGAFAIEKKGFSEYLLEEEPREKTPMPSESFIREEETSAIFQVAMEKDKQFIQLSQKLAKYEQQIKELNGQRLTLLAENERLKKSSPGTSSRQSVEEYTLSERVKNTEEILIKLREIEVELSLVILQAKNIIFDNENQEINKMLGQKIYAIDEWKAKFMQLDRMFSGMKEVAPQEQGRKMTKSKSAAKMKSSVLVISGGYIPKSHQNVITHDANVATLNLSAETLNASLDSSPLFNSKLF